MENFWIELSTIEKIYAIIGLAFSFFFLLQMILSLFGADHDSDASGDADAAVDGDTGIPFQFFTIKNMVAFLAIMGLTGFVCLRGGMEQWLAVLISLFAGLTMMAIMAAIFYFVSKLADHGNVDSSKAIGKTAEVYLTIPPTRSGQGKISLTVQGRFTEFQAVTNDEEAILTGSQVKVLEITDSQIFVVTKI
jgi:hypothetical protein